MGKIKKGSIVARISYNKDIFFIVDRIIKSSNNKKIAILKGVTIRIVADAPLNDLEPILTKDVLKKIEKENAKLERRLARNLRIKTIEVFKTGKILHLDGDRRYSEKSAKYYRRLGLNAVVKNIPENKQSQYVISLLEKYNPDILVITGHDAMLKKGTNYNNIYNYRNSRHFVQTVTNARKWANSSDKLVIFAGACQSFFEAIMAAGADFASSPGRILIDFIDPLIVAEKVAITENYKFINIYNFIDEIKEGEKGIGGSTVRGKKTRVMS